MNKAERDAYIKELNDLEVREIRVIQQTKDMLNEDKLKKIATIQAWYKRQRARVK